MGNQHSLETLDPGKTGTGLVFIIFRALCRDAAVAIRRPAPGGRFAAATGEAVGLLPAMSGCEQHEMEMTKTGIWRVVAEARAARGKSVTRF